MIKWALLRVVGGGPSYLRFREKGKGPYYGGTLVDKAINSVFAALIWHCQDLREELAPQLALSDTFHPSTLLEEAFSTAEALRRELVSTCSRCAASLSVP